MIQHSFGLLPDGCPVTLYELTNSRGVGIRLMDFGGIVQSIRVPDRQGVMGDVVLGYDDLEGYIGQTEYFGALIGRVGNRISNARFVLDGETFDLVANLGSDQLHGGPSGGFAKTLWTAMPISEETGEGVRLTYLSPDGEERYPGNLNVEVDFRLNDDNELILDYRAITDRATPISLTHHSYFNLGSSEDVLRHEMWIPAGKFLPVSERLIPTGEYRDVAGTSLDFRSPMAIGERIADQDEQLRWAGGYDHTFVLRQDDPGVAGTSEQPLSLAARVVEPESGRVLEVETTEPGMQFYSGNSLHSGIVGKGGLPYRRHAGFCLETQQFPDSPNRPEFPSTTLRPGEEYRSRTVYRFGIDDNDCKG